MKKKLKFGNLVLDHNVIYAPLAGVSDFPYRQISALFRPALLYCEMVKIEPVVRRIPETMRMLDYDESMRPIGAQICGSDPELASTAAKIVEDLGFDVVDLNCGCPVDKVTKLGCGSGMLKHPEKIGEVLRAMVLAVKIPVTVKVRAGWDSSTINAPFITKIAEEAGAKAIYVHGRTRQQGYVGNADWQVITECKKAAKEIVVIGNGDVFSPESAMQMMQETGVDGILVARGTMGNPWICQDILRAFMNETPDCRTGMDRKKMLMQHLLFSSKYKDARGTLVDAKKLISWYCKNIFQAKALRKEVMELTHFSEVQNAIDKFDWTTG